MSAVCTKDYGFCLFLCVLCDKHFKDPQKYVVHTHYIQYVIYCPLFIPCNNLFKMCLTVTARSIFVYSQYMIKKKTKKNNLKFCIIKITVTVTPCDINPVNFSSVRSHAFTLTEGDAGSRKYELRSLQNKCSNSLSHFCSIRKRHLTYYT